MKTFFKWMIAVFVALTGFVFSGCDWMFDYDVSISAVYESIPNRITVEWDYGNDIKKVEITYKSAKGDSGHVYYANTKNKNTVTGVNRDDEYTFTIVGYSYTDSNGYNEEKKASCTVKTDATGEKTGDIPKHFWGTWIRMDTGDEYYFSSYAGYNCSTKKIDFENVSMFTKDGDNVISDGTYYYFRKGGKFRSFTANIAGIEGSASYSRAIGLGATTVSRRNKENSLDKEQNLTPDSTGKVKFNDAVADDAQEVTVKTDTTSVKIETTPKYDGENIGSIPIVEKGSFGFKTSYEMTGDAQGFYYGNNYKDYTMYLYFTNIGDIVCNTSYYEITTDDPNLTISDSTTGNLVTIEPGKYEKKYITVKYGTLNDEYKDVSLSIRIEDSITGKVWNDKVVVRFYKGRVGLKFIPKNFSSKSYPQLKGFVIYPNGRSKRFYISSVYGGTEWVYIPWSEHDYYLVFSGATDATEEIGYSFCFAGKAELADISVFKPEEVMAYEPNDSTLTAARITNLNTAVKAYLRPNDVDFYIINNSSCEIEK